MSSPTFSRLPILTRFHIFPRTTSRTATITNARSTSRRTISTTAIKMSSNATSDEGHVISEMTKKEGGPSKGSAAAQMQSQVGKKRNLENTAAKVLSKLDTAPGTVTSEDASLLHSREARVTGGPTSDLTSKAHSVAAANEQGTRVQAKGAPTNGVDAGLTPAEQSQLDREANYVDAADKVGTKMATEPENVTKQDGDLLHSRETKAFGATEKGGIASQAQSLAAENAGDKA